MMMKSLFVLAVTSAASTAEILVGDACPTSFVPSFGQPAGCNAGCPECVIQGVTRFPEAREDGTVIGTINCTCKDENWKPPQFTNGPSENLEEALNVGDACPTIALASFGEAGGCRAGCSACVIKGVTEFDKPVDGKIGSIDCTCTDESPKYSVGDKCDEAALEKAGITVTDHCCDALQDATCAENTFCRIAEINYATAKCECAIAAKDKDLCDAKTLWPKTKECADGCKDCRVAKVNGKGHDAEVECGCAECPDTKTECTRAYDDNAYCQCKPPTTQSTGVEVSVCSDALYLLKDVDVTEVCSGSDETKIGKCPKKGDEAASDCRDNIFSSKDGKCFAPEDAQCVMLRSGAMGCVFPTNANARLGCLTENVCNDNYEKDPETQQCDLTNAGYPIQNKTAVSESEYINTKNMEDPQTSVKVAEDDDGLASITKVMSIFAGAILAGVSMYGSF